MQKTCCYPGCEVPLPKGHLACIDHWGSVDKHHQQAAQYRLRAWRGEGGTRGNEPAAREYLTNFFKQQIKKGSEL